MLLQGPNEGIRREVAVGSFELREAPDEDAEAGLEKLLDEVLFRLDEAAAEADQVPWDEVAADEVLAAADAWLSMASYAVTNVYAPMSPLPRGVAGLGKGSVKRLRKLAARLKPHLEAARTALGAQSFSVSVSFPLGASVSISW